MAAPSMAQPARPRYPAGRRDPTTHRSPPLIAAIVLAGGLSRRMGRPKLLLDLGGRPVIRRTVESLVGRVDDIVVVTGAEDVALRGALAGLAVRFANNPRPTDGQGSSIAVGVRALAPRTRAALVTLGDQPWLPGEVIPALVEAFTRGAGSIVVPVYRGVAGHPVLFGRDVFSELAGLTGEGGGRAIVQARPERVARIELDVAPPDDLDTPEDYARLRVE